MLAVGLAGTAVGGLAVFVKVTAAAGTRMPVLPVAAAAVVLLIGVAFAGWSVSPVRRRPTAQPDPGVRSAKDVRPSASVRPSADPPDMGADALDHAAVDADGFEHSVGALRGRDDHVGAQVAAPPTTSTGVQSSRTQTGCAS